LAYRIDVAAREYWALSWARIARRPVISHFEWVEFAAVKRGEQLSEVKASKRYTHG
jgi:hypothetical protein